MDEARLTRRGQELKLTGPLTLKTVADVARDAEKLFLDKLVANTGHDAGFTLDLSGMTRLDSAGLALMVAWLGRCHAMGIALRLVAVPSLMDPLVELYGLQEVFADPQGPSSR